MDIKCHRCGEPWELDTFHDVAAEQGITFDAAMRRFRREGCAGTGWIEPCGRTYDPAKSMALVELGDMLGDDVDGFAAMIEDFAL